MISIVHEGSKTKMSSSNEKIVDFFDEYNIEEGCSFQSTSDYPSSQVEMNFELIKDSEISRNLQVWIDMIEDVRKYVLSVFNVFCSEKDLENVSESDLQHYQNVIDEDRSPDLLQILPIKCKKNMNFQIKA